MSNSTLVDYVKISPNKTSPRRNIIDTITIHCVVGQCSVETLGNIFYPKERHASSNYGIGSDGRIGMYVEEKDACWCSSSSANDNRAVVIECASDKTHPYAVNKKVYDSLIDLLIDICMRNNIKELKWEGDKNLIGQVKKQNMTVHRWFSNTICPGDYLYNLHWKIAKTVNKKLNKEIVKTKFNFADSTMDYLSEYRFGNELIHRLATVKDKDVIEDKPYNIIMTSNVIKAIAEDVILGLYGTGQDRKDLLGILYGKVQSCVNEILK